MNRYHTTLVPSKPQWTEPYYGVTHLGSKSVTGVNRCTVTDYGEFAELDCWYPGCGVSPIESTHDDVESAKTAGEKWLHAQGWLASQGLTT